jgi:hypothetical protein
MLTFNHELGAMLQRARNLLELWLHQLIVRMVLALGPLDLLDKLDFLPHINIMKNLRPTFKRRIKFHQL